MFEKIKAKLDLVWQKLLREWKTFVLQLGLTAMGGIEVAAQWGVDIPSLLDWVPPQMKPVALFVVGMAMLLLRKYTPTTVVQKD